MSVSYYDVLGVDRDATSDQIKAAWREATDKFEPGSGSGQFRLFSEAADILLDPAKRAAYDATLDPLEAEPEPELKSKPEPEPEPEPEPKVSRPVVEAAVPEREPSGARMGRGVVAVSIGLALLCVAAFAVAGVYFLKHRQAERNAEAGDQAAAAAERAMPAVLSYDYRRLEADRDRAVKFLSPKYRKEYTATFDKLIESTPGQPGPAEQTKAVVKATVENVGLISASPQRARLVVFLNQSATKGDATPTFSLNRLAVSMARDGRTWVVDNIVSY